MIKSYDFDNLIYIKIIMESTINVRLKTTEVIGGTEPDKHYYLILSGNNMSGTIKFKYKPDIVPGNNLRLIIDNPQSVLILPGEEKKETKIKEVKEKTVKHRRKKIETIEHIVNATNELTTDTVIIDTPVVTSATEDGIVLSLFAFSLKSKMEPDLSLKEIGMFFGTENYYDVFGVTITDGIKYVMSNGYSWCISDACVLLKLDKKLKNQEFVSVKLKVLPDKKAVIIYEDGNNKVLFKQEYNYTDALVDLTLFYTNNVLMLSSEY